MIRTMLLTDDYVDIKGTKCFRNVTGMINRFLRENKAEYVDLKILNGEKHEVILIYKIKEEL